MPIVQINLIVALLLGCCAGIFTGIMPGIHTNTVAAGVLATLPFLTKWFSTLELGIFLIAMIIMHSFVDFIPSIFLGAPDDGETALSVLPGHKMLLEGLGYDALKLTIVGGVGATIIGLIMLPVFSLVVYYGYDKLGFSIPILILFFCAFFILMEKDFRGKIWALLIFIMSGILGIITLNYLSIKEPLFPLLSSLFGISTLLISMQGQNKIVEQKISDNIEFKHYWLSHIKASFSAAIMSVLPALGAAQATILAQAVTKKQHSNEEFLVIVGGINTVSSIFVLTTLFLIGRARTGVLAVMKQFLELDFNSFLILLVAGLVAIGFSVIVTLLLGKVIATKIARFKYRKISFAVLIMLIILIGFFSGWLGLFIASVGTAIGLIAPYIGVKRIHAMGCLALPAVIYFFNL
jgi:putative membrane protein